MQKPQIICRPLADWLGQSVRFQGFLDYWETASKTGDTAFLLQNVKVVPYRGGKEQMRTLDHIWLYIDKDTEIKTKFQRYGDYAAIGQVVSYIRSNGTKDFAIDIKPYVPIETHNKVFREYGESKLKHVKVRAMVLETTLNQLETEKLDFGIYLSYEEVYRHFRDEYEFCCRQVEVNERYEAKKQQRSRPKPDVFKFASTSLKSTKAARKGFATS
ncbi:hypothetical protein C7271_26555 [filamentous cyanobacterium CCP5]|nr:hypothetical protein C7271_26555 [filamentous cyanobacterium CCP5]